MEGISSVNLKHSQLVSSVHSWDTLMLDDGDVDMFCFLTEWRPPRLTSFISRKPIKCDY